jgi:hypothetical protein
MKHDTKTRSATEWYSLSGYVTLDRLSVSAAGFVGIPLSISALGFRPPSPDRETDIHIATGGKQEPLVCITNLVP